MARLRLGEQTDDVGDRSRGAPRRCGGVGAARSAHRTASTRRDPAIEEATLGRFAGCRATTMPTFGPAARRRPAPQRPGLEADQERDQRSRRRTSPRPTRRAPTVPPGSPPCSDEIAEQHQPQPVPQHPQRRRAGTPRNENPSRTNAKRSGSAPRRRSCAAAAGEPCRRSSSFSGVQLAAKCEPQIVSRRACPWSTAPRRPRADRSRTPRAAPAPVP